MSHEHAAWSPTWVLLTCEHGGRDVPSAYGGLFRGAKTVLDSHRGYDIGALGVALRMASRLSVPIIFSTVTRLLIDLNRSLDQPDVGSEFTRDMTDNEREAIADAFYHPYRDSVEAAVAAATTAGHRVLHVGVHSCTDVLHGSTRDLDIALLFDEARPLEEAFCTGLRASLLSLEPGLRYRFNEPYRGADDGLTTTLRGVFPPESYLGIEIELRQGMVTGAEQQRVAADLLGEAVRASGALKEGH